MIEQHFYIQIVTGFEPSYQDFTPLSLSYQERRLSLSIWNYSLSGILAPGSYSHRPLIRIRPSTPYLKKYNRETQNISALGKCLPKGEDYRTFFCPLRFLKYLGKRPSRPPLANDGRHRQ